MSKTRAVSVRPSKIHGRGLYADEAIPEGARIIENPFNQIPGFACGRHYFLPGFPEMAWPMMAQVLDSEYRDQQHAVVEVEDSMRVIDGGAASRFTTCRNVSNTSCFAAVS